MAIELRVDGYYDVIITEINGGEEVSETVEKNILKLLQSGEYVFSMNGREIYHIANLFKPLYNVELEPSDNVEYNWDIQF